MNEMINTPPARKQGRITGFSAYTDKMLTGMKADVGLCMSLPELRMLRNLYRNPLRRDAYLDELYMFDRLLAARRLTGTAIDEVYINSDGVAAAYADLQTKFAAVHPKNAPATLGSLASVTHDYLQRVGRLTFPGRDCALCAGELADIELMLRGYNVTARTDSAALGVRKSGATAAPAGSLLVLISQWGGLSAGEFREKMAQIMSSGAAEKVLDGGVLGAEGLIGWLGSRGGAYIDLSTMSPIFGQLGVSGLELLTQPLTGAALAVIAAENVNEFMATVYSLKLWTGIIGCTTSDMKLKVNCGPTTLSYPVAVLNSVTPLEHTAADLSAATDDKNSDGLAHSHTSRRTDAHAFAVHSIEDRTGSGISFRDAHDAVIYAVADCVAGGADFTDVCLSLETAVGALPDINATGDIPTALGCLLGAYRAQIEYLVPDSNSRIRLTDSAPCFTVSAAAKPGAGRHTAPPRLLGKSKPEPSPVAATNDLHVIPNAVQSPGGTVYLLTPVTDAAGHADYEDMRRMWQYAAHRAAEGAIVAATAVTHDGVIATLQAMLSDGLAVSLATNLSAADLENLGHVPGSILAVVSPDVAESFDGACTAVGVVNGRE